MTYHKLKLRWTANQQQRQARAQSMKKIVVEKGSPIFKKFGIQTAILFGSVQHAHCDRNSDIDLLVSSLASRDYWTFRHELEEALDYPLDLYTQDDDPTFVSKIRQRGEVIYDLQS